MHRPIPPRRISSKVQTPRPRSFLSVLPASRRRTSASGRVRSRFHSRAFIERSRWPSRRSMNEHLACTCSGDYFGDIAIRDKSCQLIVVTINDTRGSVWPCRNLVRMLNLYFSAVIEMNLKRLERRSIHQLEHLISSHPDHPQSNILLYQEAPH